MTSVEFVAFCKAAAGLKTVYGWGMWGKPLTDEIIDAKAKQYPTHYDSERIAYLKSLVPEGYVGCDCTGLIKWGLWTGGDISKTPVYASATDKSASGWYNAASVRGAIGTMPETPGLILSMSGHCGVYIGGGRVIQCTRGANGDGVVETSSTVNAWEKWCECPYIEYSAQEDEKLPISPPYQFTNGAARTDAYADSLLTKRVGSLDPNEVCGCYGLYEGCAAVVYNISGGLKTGFVAEGSGTVSAV